MASATYDEGASKWRISTRGDAGRGHETAIEADWIGVAVGQLGTPYKEPPPIPGVEKVAIVSPRYCPTALPP